MPSIRLTQAAIDKMKPPVTGRVVYWDRFLPGFGLMITANGAKSWKAMYRVGGKSVMETIGSLAVIPKVDNARELARRSMLKARQGVNPVAEKKVAKETAIEAAREATEGTVRHIVRCYLAKHIDPNYRPGSAREVHRHFEKDVLSRWGNCDLAAIKRAEVRRLISDLNERAPSTATHMLAMLKTFFRWAVAEEFIDRDQDPTLDLKPPTKYVQRERILSNDEIVGFWSACEKIGWPYGALFKLLLLTAQRRTEVGHMTWDEIDTGKRIWVIPAERAKNGVAHIVHLSQPALEIINSLPQINGSKFVFTTTGATPVAGWSASKTALDRHMPPGAPFTLHDLRRTAASGMAGLGIAPQIVDKVLNHSSVVKGVARIYNRYEYIEERKAALDAWARYIESLIRPGPANVVPLRTAEN